MAISKVVYSGQTLIDLTGDTVSVETLAKNATAHDKAGNLIVGQMESGGGSTPDYACLYKEVKVTSATTSGATTWVTQAELLAAGIISATSQEMTTQWNHYSVEVGAVSGSITHRNKQITFMYATDGGSIYSGSTTYRRFTEYHNSSTTSTSMVRQANPITTNTTGYLYSNASYGIRTTASSTYGIGIATYYVKIACWGHK